MTTVEMLWPKYGDALIDLRARRGVGFDQCTITDLDITGDTISFRISSSELQRRFLVRFRDLDGNRKYRIVWNGNATAGVAGAELSKTGHLVGPLK
jgi:hypothetical protein